MSRRHELIVAEDLGWRELNDLISRLTREQREYPGVGSESWSVKDLMWHIGCWSAEGACQLERIRMDTYDGWDGDVDGRNAEWLTAGRGQDYRTVEAEWYSSRNRMLEEVGALRELPPNADEWFRESGAEHYAEHLPDLRALVDRLTS